MVMRKRTKTRARKSAPRRRFGRKGKALKYPDGLNVKLQHNDAVVYNVTGTNAPFAEGSGVVTNAIPKATINGLIMNDVTGAHLFRLRDTLQWQQFNTMYDRVKINGVKIQFIPQWSQGFSNTDLGASTVYNSTSLIPTMKIVRDYDDSTPGPTLNSIWARRGRVFRLNRPFSVFVKPRMRQGVLSIGQGNGQSGIIPAISAPAQFLDVASAPDVAHFGLKWAIKDWCGSNDLRLQIVTTYYVSFKNMLAVGLTPKGETITEVHDLLDEENVPCEEQPPPEQASK